MAIFAEENRDPATFNSESFLARLGIKVDPISDLDALDALDALDDDLNPFGSIPSIPGIPNIGTIGPVGTIGVIRAVPTITWRTRRALPGTARSGIANPKSAAPERDSRSSAGILPASLQWPYDAAA